MFAKFEHSEFSRWYFFWRVAGWPGGRLRMDNSVQLSWVLSLAKVKLCLLRENQAQAPDVEWLILTVIILLSWFKCRCKAQTKLSLFKLNQKTFFNFKNVLKCSICSIFSIAIFCGLQLSMCIMCYCFEHLKYK